MPADTERFLFVHRFTNGKAARKLRLRTDPLRWARILQSSIFGTKDYQSAVTRLLAVVAELFEITCVIPGASAPGIDDRKLLSLRDSVRAFVVELTGIAQHRLWVGNRLIGRSLY
jgi:hypothetical protein